MRGCPGPFLRTLLLALGVVLAVGCDRRPPRFQTLLLHTAEDQEVRALAPSFQEAGDLFSVRLAPEGGKPRRWTIDPQSRRAWDETGAPCSPEEDLKVLDLDSLRNTLQALHDAPPPRFRGPGPGHDPGEPGAYLPQWHWVDAEYAWCAESRTKLGVVFWILGRSAGLPSLHILMRIECQPQDGVHRRTHVFMVHRGPQSPEDEVFFAYPEPKSGWAAIGSDSALELMLAAQGIPPNRHPLPNL